MRTENKKINPLFILCHMARTCGIALKVGRSRHQYQGWETSWKVKSGCCGLGHWDTSKTRFEEITSLLHIGIKL